MLMKQQRAEDAVRVWIFHGSGAVHVIHTVWSAEQTTFSKLWRLWAAQFYEYPAQRRLVWELLWFILWQEWREAGHAWRGKHLRRETITQRKTGENLFVQGSAADWSVTGNWRSGIYLRRTKNLRGGRKVEGQRKAGGKGNCWWLYLRNEELDRWWCW